MGQASKELLKVLLRRELSAVQTYSQILTHFVDDPPVYRILEDCYRSHAERVSTLTREVIHEGGEPEASTGLSGALTALAAHGAQFFGKRATLSALEEDENRRSREYAECVQKLRAGVRALVESTLFPEQRRTQALMTNLQSSL